LNRRITLECNRSIAANSGRSIVNEKEESVDHNEAIRKLDHLLIREAGHAQEAAIELEALIPFLLTDKSRQLAHLQVKASHKQATEFRELAQKAKET
jgi:hypothetical protein